MAAPVLSVVMPCYNEEATLETIIERVLLSPLVKELVVVDDGSSDRSREILSGIRDERVRAIFHEVNQGKGAALRTGFKEARAPYVIIQDADLEYDPSE